MQTLKGQKAVVTGGSRGLGLGITEALVARGVDVTVLARNEEQLNTISQRLGVKTVCGDITDEQLVITVLQDVKPTILVLNAGATPVMKPLHEATWNEFNTVWDVDVKGSFLWVQQALRQPLQPGSRVIIGSSGAAVGGSPLSGSYAGAKRMQWFMANYANGAANELGLDIRFQAILPMQIIGETELGRKASEAYAQRKGVSAETYLAGFGASLPPQKVGEHVVSILTEPQYETGVAFGIKGGSGIVLLDK